MRSLKRQIAQNSGFATKPRKNLADAVLVSQRVDFTEGGAHGAAGQVFKAAIDMYIVDIVVHCSAANSNGTAQLRRGTTAISDAIACATANAIQRAGTIAAAEISLNAGQEYNVKTNATGDKGFMTIVGVLR